MSRGLGKLQQAILDTLDDAKRECVRYRGRDGDDLLFDSLRIRVPSHVYDLRASAKYLSRKTGRVQPCPQFQTEGFQASFSRAVRQLINRGLLKSLSLIPVVHSEGEGEVHRLTDGDYVFDRGQTRFVTFGGNGQQS